MAMNTIMDYIIAQAEINDRSNLSIEIDIRDKVLAIYDSYLNRIRNMVVIYGEFKNYAQMNTMLYKVQDNIVAMYNDIYKLLIPTLVDYNSRAESQLSDLLEIATEVAKSIEQISEVKKKMYDPQTIENITTHGFQSIVNIREDQIKQIRTDVEKLFKENRYTKENVIDTVMSVLNSDRSRADSIAQTEMSIAYNTGMMNRMKSYMNTSNKIMYKYWHGFKYSDVTCTYCRPRIGNYYRIDDNTEVLPAHVRCRCIWLPYQEEWDKPISMDIMRNADMLQRVYNPQEIYNKINSRLGINYAQYLESDDALAYISGKRSDELANKFDKARTDAIKATTYEMNVSSKSPTKTMATEYEQQIDFWKKYTSTLLVDNNTEGLNNTKEAIKGVMVLPWQGQQLNEFEKLLDIIDDHLKK